MSASAFRAAPHTAQLGAVFGTMEGARQSLLVALVNRVGGRLS